MPKLQKEKRRKICFIITSFIHYSRSLLILEELRKRPDIELHIVIGGTALLPKYSSKYAFVKNILKDEGYKNLYEVYFNLEGDSPTVKAQTAGLGLIEFAHLFNNIKPDLIVVRGDRFEVLSAATAASYMNIPIAHIEGGDVTGTMDESVRHSITKLSHIHFVTNEAARERVLRMGEHKKYVFNYGSPEIEIAHKVAGGRTKIDLSTTGSGATVDPKKGYLMVMYHPVSTNIADLRDKTRVLLSTIHRLNLQTLWFWPNFDLGADDISHELRKFNDETENHRVRFLRYLPPQEFLLLLRSSKMLIGNSSAGIKECSYFGIPVVNVGTRQAGRLRAGNVIDVLEEEKALERAIKRQLTAKKYPSSKLYFAPNTSRNIAKTLATVNLYVQKRFHENRSFNLPAEFPDSLRG